MELLGVAVVLIGVLGAAIFFTRGLFARDLAQAMERVRSQEKLLQEKADLLEQRLGQMEREHQAGLKRAQAEAERLIQEAKEQAMNVRSVAVEESKHRARQLLLEAEQAKSQMRGELVREMNGAAAAHACEALRGLLSEDQMGALHEALMKQLLEELKRVDLRLMPVKVNQIEVAAARPLTSPENLRLSQWAAASVGSDVPIRITVDTLLAAGAVVKAGETVVDNSLLSRISR